MPRFQQQGMAYRGSRTPYGRPARANQSRPKRGRGQYIDPSRFIKVAQPIASEDYVPTHLFSDFAFDARLQQNLNAKGFVAPTPIQDATVALGLEGRDVIGVADTGTGKTAAFALPLLHRLMSEPKSRALVVAPTRELAMQIEEECRTLGKGGGFGGAVLIGGSAYGPQLRDLRADPKLVIGTPGRIKDHIERGTLQLDKFNIVVLDEVDRMLDMGFVDEVRLLLAQLAKERQSFYFSATLDSRVNTLIRTFSPDAETITVKQGDTSSNVHQDVVRYSGSGEKQEKLHEILIDPATHKVIVFEETQRGVERLEKDLLVRGFKVASIHGGKSQGQRARALREFKANQVMILVATDVAARGLDVKDISHVVNYTQPQTYDDYVHRVGRAGRAGKTGYALTFVQK